MLYQSEAFSLWGNRVTQGLYEAVALTPTSIISNYQSPANDRHSRVVDFKFSLNGKDNELPIGIHHKLVLFPRNGEVVSPLITFGQTYTDTSKVPDHDFLEANTRLRIRLDMRPVLQAFEQEGYYTDYAGNRLYKEDFKGVYVAGATEPLSWDFDSLPAQEGLALSDPDGDGIYEVTLVLNRTNPEDFTASRWELREDISHYPRYSSGFPIIDALYNLSLEELKLDIRPDNTFMAGEEWFGVWTRDISYSILLSLAALEPEVSKNSLMAKVQEGRIVQDTGTGGSWPVSTDRVTWALAAWEVYAVKGDEGWLRQAYDIISKSVEEDLHVAFNEQTGLFRGESSFLDWRSQSYPRWMEPVGIYMSESLGTNAAHYETYQILARMANILGESAERWQKVAQRVKEGINEHLWQPERGYYGQYLYGNAYLLKSPRAEALGEALSVLFGIADQQQAAQVLSQMPVTKFGVTSIYPQIPDVPPYHNEGIWPFVQAYWNWAAARGENQEALQHGLSALYRQAALFLTNKENFVASSGDFKGTEINSNRQLWSVAGNLAMVYRVFFGMHFEPMGIRLKPAVPQAYADTRRLSNFRYRNALLNLEIKGWGTEVEEVLLDDKKLDDPLIPAHLQGEHTVKIRLANRGFQEGKFQVAANHTSLPTPAVSLHEGVLSWQAVKDAVAYQLWQNGQLLETLTTTQYKPAAVDAYAEYAVTAVDAAGWTSFISEPMSLVDPASVHLIQAEQLTAAAHVKLSGFSGTGFVELSRESNAELGFTLTVPQAGAYLFDVRYSNGSGPVNTDNKAAIRSLYVEDQYAGPVVMPQRGEEAWSDWGFSNPLQIWLEEGENQLQLRLMPWNENMNKDVNRAMLDYIRVIKL